MTDDQQEMSGVQKYQKQQGNRVDENETITLPYGFNN